MPVSCPSNISPIAREICRLQPKSVLDVAIGCGLYGAVARNYLDGEHGRVQEKDWKTRIFGVEGFKEYRNPLWAAYNVVVVEDFRQIYQTFSKWDLVLALDCLEHCDKTEAQIILETLVQNNKRVIVSVPVGECPQEGVFGNELERHRATWYGNEFSKYDHIVLHQSVCKVVSIKGKEGRRI